MVQFWLLMHQLLLCLGYDRVSRACRTSKHGKQGVASFGKDPVCMIACMSITMGFGRTHKQPGGALKLQPVS